MTEAKQPLRCEVTYALPQRQSVVQVTLEEGATAGDAVTASGLLVTHPELSGERLVLGIFGTLVAPERELRDGDRVEIYRALQVDPRTARRERARKPGPRRPRSDD
jgi:putative ubiquitin-RnfH superfamily antitoxin RatB of RatAB toxin-antitoxin module